MKSNHRQEREETMMKKLLALLTILTLVFGLAACMGSGSTQTTPPQTDPSAEATTLPTTVPTTVPDPMADSLLRSMDLTGKTLEEAAQALTDAVASYKLSLTVNGSKATLAAGDIMVAVDKQALAVTVRL